MTNTTLGPTAGAAVDPNNVAISGSALGMGGSASLGTVGNNLHGETTSATNWGPILQERHTEGSSIGANGLASHESHATTIGGSNGFSTGQSKESSLGANGFHASETNEMRIGGQEIYNMETTNDNCCCSCKCSCCGEGISCNMSGCCESIGDCLSSSFSCVKTCLSGFSNCACNAAGAALDVLGCLLSGLGKCN